MKTIVEKNILIAEFMEYHFDKHENAYYIQKYNSGDWFSIEELLFHESWDAIMPVVDKIYITGLDEHDINEIGDITHALLDVNINAVHEAVVKFIEMYNKQK